MTVLGSGHRVNTGSCGGIVSIPYQISYVVSKFSVVRLSEALYSVVSHLHPDSSVSVLCPSYLYTRIIDRTNMKMPATIVRDMAGQEPENSLDEFKQRFWIRYSTKAMPLDRAAKNVRRESSKESYT